ncbi:hypothetical protein K505DRAFT_101638, partial [Melanomma pulvis-pyrius CBS 109.77]
MRVITLLPLAALAFALPTPDAKPDSTTVEIENIAGPIGSWHGIGKRVPEVDVDASNSAGQHGTWFKREAAVNVEAVNSPGRTRGSWIRRDAKAKPVNLAVYNAPGPKGSWLKREAAVNVEAVNSPGRTRGSWIRRDAEAEPVNLEVYNAPGPKG